MKFQLTKASDLDDDSSNIIEINTLEELMELISKEGRCVVDDNEIIIYDYYLE